jgi:hypothetical protein
MPRPRSAAQGFLHHEANDLSRTILEQNLRGTHLDPAGHGSVEFCDEHAVLAVRTDPGQASADLDDVTRVPELAGQPRERRAVAYRPDRRAPRTAPVVWPCRARGRRLRTTVSSSSMEAVGIAVVLGVIAVAAVASLFRRPHGPRSGPRR